jgi:hypothetical protein
VTNLVCRRFVRSCFLGRRSFPRFALILCILAIGIGREAQAHDVPHGGKIVIDTDMGLDDTVALAIALQHPDLDIRALVVTPGAMSADQAASYAERLLYRFNRSDVEVFVSKATSQPARTHAAQYVGPALKEDVPQRRKPAAPIAYVGDRAQTTVVVLGPLTTLAEALEAKPMIAARIHEVIIAGLPEPSQNWNLQLDPAAYDVVRKAGIAMTFVAPGKQGSKPSDWNLGKSDYGPGTSVGELFVRDLLSPPDTREHYLEMLDQLTDELPILYLGESALFQAVDPATRTLSPANRDTVLANLRDTLAAGRQRRVRTIFADGPLPAAALRPEVAARQDRIIAKHGETEWFAQVLLNETHQHLGAYSIIGVKMGLHAAELLNAPQHGMTVVSHTAPAPPVCCMNDGVIMSTGCTPGRALFRHEPTTDLASTSVTFRYNGRQVTLRLKPAYQQQIRAEIQKLLTKY